MKIKVTGYVILFVIKSVVSLSNITLINELVAVAFYLIFTSKLSI